jgi:serine/threonine-protein kinase
VESIGGWRVLGELGRGASGTVYKAGRDGAVAAVKVLGSAAASDPVLRERFRREGRALAELDHPAIVRLLEAGTAAEPPYLVLEYVEGPSFDRCIARKAFTPRDTAFLVSAVARGLHHAHRQGIVHADVAPRNILLKSDGSPKLTDFGLARRSGEPGRPGVTAGTPVYMSPEQASGMDEVIGPRSDVYSLGAVLYEALSGRPPHSGRGTAEILARVVRDAPAPLGEAADPELAGIVERAMDKDPARRYPTAKDFADALHGWASRAADWFSMLPT